MFFLVIIALIAVPFGRNEVLFLTYARPGVLGLGGPSGSLGDELGAISVSPTTEENKIDSILFEDGGAFVGVSPSLADVPSARDGIKKYKMKKGDTFSGVAAQFGITLETLRASNANVTKPRAGQELTILPVSGTLYIMKGGDTIQGIAEQLGVSVELIKKYNPQYTGVAGTQNMTLVLPPTKEISKFVAPDMGKEELADIGGYFILPAKGWNWGVLHEYNAVDIANSCGSAIYATASGVVVEESSDGSWNNGYGNYILVEHANKTKTRYAHTLKNNVGVGDVVSQGEKIALIGNSGNTQGATGCHVHFEVIGAKNPFALK